MTQPRAFEGFYSDFKLVKTRQVAQIVMEIPLANATEFVRLFGLPDPAAEQPLAIAKLNPKKTIDAVAEPKTPKDKRTFKDLPAATQAVLTGQEPRFWAFLREEHNYSCFSEDEAANAVRAWCGVESRAELRPNSQPAHKWHFLITAFQAWEAAEHAGI